MKKNELMEYVQSNYGAVAEYPWAKFPSYIIYRHKNNAKWFAAILTISSKRLYESECDEMINIINLKSPPELVGSLRLKEGVYPAYHMNKEHWITIKLDSGFPEDELKVLIDESYKLTAK